MKSAWLCWARMRESRGSSGIKSLHQFNRFGPRTECVSRHWDKTWEVLSEFTFALWLREKGSSTRRWFHPTGFHGISRAIRLLKLSRHLCTEAVSEAKLYCTDMVHISSINLYSNWSCHFSLSSSLWKGFLIMIKATAGCKMQLLSERGAMYNELLNERSCPCNIVKKVVQELWRIWVKVPEVARTCSVLVRVSCELGCLRVQKL